jgi:general secretion pathway protein G
VRKRGGFTLIEILMVVIIVSIVLALLLPAINAAMRSARRAAVSSEISLLAQALANFKSKYGDYPPSRFLAVESGNYAIWIGSNQPLNNTGLFPANQDASKVFDPTSPGTNDITMGQLAQRSVAALRKMFPRVSTTGGLPPGTWYDFNGNGIPDPLPYVLHGHECLVFFLGGVPTRDASGNFGLSGFDKNPTNPFTSPAVSSNRQPPLFEFTSSRLFVDPATQFLDPNTKQPLVPPYPGVPAYYDSLGNSPPAAGNPSLNFYAYFSAYINGAYDPNDVNFGEGDIANPWPQSGPIGLNFSVAFPTFLNANASSNISLSYAPNPYTSTLTILKSVDPVNNVNNPDTISFQTPQSFQIIASGFDGLYGVGGQFAPGTASTTAEALPIDNFTKTPVPYVNTADVNVRRREQDNITNFKSGSLE